MCGTPGGLFTCTISLCIKICGIVQTWGKRMRKKPLRWREKESGRKMAEALVLDKFSSPQHLFNSSLGFADVLRFYLFSHSVLQYESALWGAFTMRERKQVRTRTFSSLIVTTPQYITTTHWVSSVTTSKRRRFSSVLVYPNTLTSFKKSLVHKDRISELNRRRVDPVISRSTFTAGI